MRTLLQRLGHGDGSEVQLDLISVDDPLLEADLAWHMRAWGRWVLAHARKGLAFHYPTYADLVPLTAANGRSRNRGGCLWRSMRAEIRKSTR